MFLSTNSIICYFLDEFFTHWLCFCFLVTFSSTLVILDIVILDIVNYFLFTAGFCYISFNIVRPFLQKDELLWVSYSFRLVLKFF